MQYQQLIITEPVGNFRALARRGIQGRWGDVMKKGFLYMILLVVPVMIIGIPSGMFDIPGLVGADGASTGYFDMYDDIGNGYEYGTDEFDAAYAQMIETVNRSSVYSWLEFIYRLFVGAALTFGITSIFLRYRRGQEATTDMIFSGFSNYSRSLALALLIAIFTFLWTLLFIVPGIIAFYRYRLAFYILIENPEIGPLEAINISKALMTGNKWKLFCLDLSFIGWGLLAILAAIIVAVIVSVPVSVGFSAGGAAGFMGGYIISLIVSAVVMCFAWGLLLMYHGTAKTAFYERASGLLKYTDEIGGTPGSPWTPPRY
jgi:uncharacterized membrane protein